MPILGLRRPALPARVGQLNEGFSYLWMLFAVALLGIGFALFSESLQTSLKRQREAELLAIGHEFREAIKRYYDASPGGKQYPPSLQDLVSDPRFPTIRRHLRRVYADPVTGKAEWGAVRLAGRVVGVHSLSDAEPFKMANFELDDTTFTGRSKYSEWVFSYPAAGALPAGTAGATSNLPGAVPIPGAFPPAGANPLPGANAQPAGGSLTGNNSLFGPSLPANASSRDSPSIFAK